MKRYKYCVAFTSLLYCSFGLAQSTHNSVLCNVINKTDGRPISADSVKLDVRVEKHTAANIHAQHSQGARRVMLIQDASASMRDNSARQPSTQAIQGFIGAASPDDQVGLVNFNDTYYLDITPRAPAPFLEKYNDPDFQERIRFFGGTALFDAIIATASFMKKEPQEGDSIVVLSDGDDDASRLGSQAVQDELRGSGIRLYLMLLPAPKRMNPNGGRSRSAMTNLVRETGGLVGNAASGHFNIEEWTRSVHSLIRETYKVEFDLDSPVRQPTRLEFRIAGDDRRNVQLACPEYLVSGNENSPSSSLR